MHGKGSPLLLIHGGAGNGLQFSKQVPEFARHHRLIVPDCCDQGRTSCRADTLTYHEMAEDMIALLDHLGVRRVDVMGWSDGANIGLDLAMNHPDRVNHVVTFGANFSPGGLREPDRTWAANATPESLGTGTRDGWTQLALDLAKPRELLRCPFVARPQVRRVDRTERYVARPSHHGGSDGH